MSKKQKKQERLKGFYEMMAQIKTLPRPEGEVLSFNGMMARIETLWEDLRASISDLPEEKQKRIVAIVEELDSLTSQAEEEART